MYKCYAGRLSVIRLEVRPLNCSEARLRNTTSGTARELCFEKIYGQQSSVYENDVANQVALGLSSSLRRIWKSWWLTMAIAFVPRLERPALPVDRTAWVSSTATASKVTVD